MTLTQWIDLAACAVVWVVILATVARRTVRVAWDFLRPVPRRGRR